MRRFSWTIPCLAACLPLACTTTRELTPVNEDGAIIQRLAPERAWRVVEGGELAGFVVRFVDPITPTRCSYSVRNPLQQELGTIDELGRAWRFIPHQREAQWVCTATLSQGAARLLERSAAASLEAVDLESLKAGEASAQAR